MGADAKKLRSRIKSVNATLHLTKAMGLVASSKIRRATEAMNQSRTYAASVRKVISLLTASPECAKSPYMAQRDGGKTCLVVVAGDRGLAGGYNANVFRFVKTLPEAGIVPIGKRSCDRFGGGHFQAGSFGYQDAIGLSQELCRQYTDGVFDRLGIVSTAYRSMLTQEPQVNWVLPLAREESGSRQSVVFEPDERTMLEAVVPEYVAGLLIAAVRESYASEVAARRNAMDSAGKNAQQMIDDLQLSYNRARQSAITQEITEIVAGAGD